MVRKKLIDVLRPILETRSAGTLVKILKLVVKRGSCYYNEISKEVRVDPARVLSHLKYLEKHGFVKLREVKREKIRYRVAVATNLAIRLIEVLESEFDFPDRIWHVYEDYEKLV